MAVPEEVEIEAEGARACLENNSGYSAPDGRDDTRSRHQPHFHVNGNNWQSNSRVRPRQWPASKQA